MIIGMNILKKMIHESRKNEHHFRTEDAEKYGVEKAILLYNLRFWLDRNRANKSNIHEKGGKNYYWTFNSGSAFAELFPYIAQRSIERYLVELENEEIIISGVFNEVKYDRTKWYTMPQYEAFEKPPSAKLANGTTQNGEPIPDINADSSNEPSPSASVDSFLEEEERKLIPTDGDGFPLVPKGPNLSKIYNQMLDYMAKRRSEITNEKFTFKGLKTRHYKGLKILREQFKISPQDVYDGWEKLCYEYNDSKFLQSKGFDLYDLITRLTKKG